MRWIAFVLLLLIPTTVSAETNKRNLWIALGLMPVAFFHETTLHEAAHVVVAKAAVPGLEVTRFAPYPCHDSEGKFHFGCFASTYPGTIGDSTRIAISIAPYVLSTSAFVVSDLLLSTRVVKPKGPAGAVLYMLGMFAPFIDFAMNFVFNRGDWQEIRQRSHGSSIAFNLVGGVLLVAGTYRLVKQGFEVFQR
jgi:hypothetical protein